MRSGLWAEWYDLPSIFLVHHGCCVGKRLRVAAGRPGEGNAGSSFISFFFFLSKAKRLSSRPCSKGIWKTARHWELGMVWRIRYGQVWDRSETEHGIEPRGTETELGILRHEPPCWPSLLPPLSEALTASGYLRDSASLHWTGYIFLLCFLNLLLLLLLFWYLRGTSVDICFGKVGCIPMAAPEGEGSLYLRGWHTSSLWKQCHFLEIKCKTYQLLSWALVYLSSFPSSSQTVSQVNTGSS